jgi:hypothetical protein
MIVLQTRLLAGKTCMSGKFLILQIIIVRRQLIRFIKLIFSHIKKYRKFITRNFSFYTELNNESSLKRRFALFSDKLIKFIKLIFNYI